MSKKQDYSKVLKEPKPKSIWDGDVDMDKVEKLSPKEKHKLFPDDYAPDGKLYDDF